MSHHTTRRTDTPGHTTLYRLSLAIARDQRMHHVDAGLVPLPLWN